MENKYTVFKIKKSKEEKIWRYTAFIFLVMKKCYHFFNYIFSSCLEYKINEYKITYVTVIVQISIIIFP